MQLWHQVIFMKDIDQADLGYLLEFIYLGEVAVPNAELERLVNISRDLGIVGLNDALGEMVVDDKRPLRRAVKRKSDSTKRGKAKMARGHRPEPSYDDFQDDHIFLEDYIDNTLECDVSIEEGCEDDEYVESCGEEGQESFKKGRKRQGDSEDIKGEVSDDDDDDDIPPDAPFATKMEGNTGKGTIYVIGDYLYNHFGSRERKHFYLRCRKHKSGLIPCRGSAIIKKKTLQVVKFTGEHREAIQ